MKQLIICLSVVAAVAACAKSNSKPQHGIIPPPSASAAQKLQGTVLETIDSGGFTYLRLGTPAGERWVVTSPVSLQKGQSVTVNAAMTVDNFESKSLNRKFDQIVFGSIEGAPRAGQHGAAPATVDAAAPADVSVPKAEGANAKTVAEIWAERAKLKDGQVVVRGTVVKFLPSIMGKNWMHVRDGSGAAAKGDNDIAVITDDTAKVGSVVLVTGTVRVDKDFGAGYSYPVILDQARLK